MIPLVILLLVLVLVVFPLWAIVRIFSVGEKVEALERGLIQADRELRELREKVRSTGAASDIAAKPAPPAPSISDLTSPPRRGPEPVAPPAPPAIAPAPTAPPLAVPPIISAAAEPPALEPPIAARTLPPQPAPDFADELPAAPPDFAVEPPSPDFSAQPVFGQSEPCEAPVAPAGSIAAGINWEQFMGAKLFAWLGGFAAFLGAAFFVKYSFEHDLIPPEIRVALGFLLALGLLVGGLKIPRERYDVTAQTFCATGIVILYAVTFACNSVYHFAFFGSFATFLLMTLITATAFLLAVRLEARVVAILGMLGGFLTPVLLSTGHDNPGGLFGYLALLDVGLVAVALHRRWHFLVPLGAVGTVMMQIGWAGKFFAAEKAGVAIVVCLGFSALFLAACAFARRRGLSSPALTWSAAALPCVCFGFALYFLGYPAVGARLGLLFAFVLLADLGLLALAWLEGKPLLAAGAAAGALLFQVGWMAEFLTAARAPAAMAVCLGFCALFFATYLVARRLGRASPEIMWSAVTLPFVALAFGFVFLGYPAIAARPGLLFTFVLAADACLLVLAWCDENLPRLHLVAGLVVFTLLAAWTTTRLTTELLPWALAFYLLHAGLHTAFPLVLEHHRPAAAPTWWSQLFPPLALLLMLGPLFKFDAVSLLFWPCVLLVDLLAIGLALFTASLAAIAIVLLLTLGATGLWIFRVPATLAAEPSLLVVIGGFALLFFAAGTFLTRKFGDRLAAAPQTLPGLFGDTRAQIPAFSALLPFLLLIMMTQRLPLANPSSVFGLALLLVVLTLGLACMLAIEWLPACALVGVAGLEYAWHAWHFAAGFATVPLAWFLIFDAAFAAYPFVFRRQFAALTGPWAIAAIAGVLQFPLVYRLVQAAWPNDFLGVLPALFAVPPLLSLVIVLRTPPADERARLSQLAWFGGVALLFITLIFPIQFERQWLTLGWALEGAALLWLFRRVPHPGLRATGAVLLVAAFARLAVNPAVLEYHARSATALLNWYLYSYGLVTACLFLGARLTAPPRERILGTEAPPLFNALGTVLAFLLLNIEIADFFSAPGTRVLTFQFSGNFARDMTYTISWALFALGLLLVSIWRDARPGRYAAIGLLSAALLKVFFRDLARLDSLYRIGALFAVAVIAVVASVAYQRFLPGSEKNDPEKPRRG